MLLQDRHADGSWRQGALRKDPLKADGIAPMDNEVVLLLVEDENLTMMMAEEALQSGGYAVIAAATGAEAMGHLDSDDLRISGVITDIGLGSGPNGWDVAHHARRLHPNMPIIYTTSENIGEWPIQGVPTSVLLQKPYASAQLVTAISALLVEVQSKG